MDRRVHIPAFTSVLLLATMPAHAANESVSQPVLVAAPMELGSDVLGTSDTQSDAAPPLPASAPVAEQPATPAAQPPKNAPPPADQGVITVTAPAHHAPGDPFEGINVKSYDVVQKFDKTLVAPAAKAYKNVVPSPLRKGFHNFLSNLGEPVIAMNFLLQLHPGRALKTVGRFGLNTTIGLGGFLDVAKTRTFKLPFHPNGFADTLGYYGVKTGPYFYLPFLGATTLRDFVGYTVDGFGLPTLIGKPFNKLYYTIPANTIRSLDYRVRYDNQLREIRETRNPYVTARITYLQQRRDEIEALHSHKADASKSPVTPDAAPTAQPNNAPTTAPATQAVPATPATTTAPTTQPAPSTPATEATPPAPPKQ